MKQIYELLPARKIKIGYSNIHHIGIEIIYTMSRYFFQHRIQKPKDNKYIMGREAQ